VAVAVVVTVEEPPLLLAVQRIIGGIEVKNDLLRCALMRITAFASQPRLACCSIATLRSLVRRFCGVGCRGGFGGFRPGFGFRRFGFFPRRQFIAAVPFGIGLGYGAFMLELGPTSWGWQRAWGCGDGGG
jgi:hypothetical protein